jgi:hypothetical protein
VEALLPTLAQLAVGVGPSGRPRRGMMGLMDVRQSDDHAFGEDRVDGVIRNSGEPLWTSVRTTHDVRLYPNVPRSI